MQHSLLRGGKRCLVDTHPAFSARLVDPEVGLTVHAGSTRKVEWLCDKGHTYTSPVRNVVLFHRGCNVCAGKVVVPGVNDIVTTHPEVADEIVDVEAARHLTAGSNKRIRWRCRACGQEWDASPNSRLGKNSSGCPVCAGRAVVAGVNDLATVAPQVAAELCDQSLATRLARTSNKVVRWRCEHGHEWEAAVSSRTAQGTGCPYCSGRLAIEGKTDLATVRPDLAAQLVDKLLGSVLLVGSSRVVEWECEEGHRWSCSVRNRALRDSGCPYCSGHLVIEGKTDLATVRPDLAAQLVDESLGRVLPVTSNKVVRWRCEHGHEWDAVVSSRTAQGTGCPYCSGRLAIEGETDLATLRPDLAAQLVDESLAGSLKCGSSRKVDWRCPEGHVWSASPKERSYHGTGCPVCACSGTSVKEREFADVVCALVGKDVEVLTNDRSVLGGGLELDVVVPSRRVAFEFNGLWWHSEEAGRPRSYHRDKVRVARDAGYRLVMVWEDDWDVRRECVVRMMAAKLGVTSRVGEVLPGVDAKAGARVFARQLDVCDVGGREARAFLEANHIQGAVSATRHLGLRDADGDLRAVLSLRSPRANSRMRRGDGVWEIQRYATLGVVVGGFSRLLAHAERRLSQEGSMVREWVSFSANDVSDGRMYERCGFVRSRDVRPDYRYVGHVTGWRRRPKESFQRHDFRDREDLAWDESWTERQAACANGLLRIWDAGKVRWSRKVGE